MKGPRILMIMCDPYLAGIYGRKFELAGWQTSVAEEVVDGERQAAKVPPAILLLDIDCVADPVDEVKRLRSLPTLIRTKIVLLAQDADRPLIESVLRAGADDMLLLGHFVPQETVDKMQRLLIS